MSRRSVCENFAPVALRTLSLVGVLLAAGLIVGSVGSRSAFGAARSGGLTVPSDPSLTGVECLKRCVTADKATPGALVRFKGRHLDDVRRVVFPGKSGHKVARAIAAVPGAVRVRVPRGAGDGHPYAVDGSGIRSNRLPGELRILPASAIPTQVFPVKGPYNFGSSGARFGARRAGHIHQGQDIIASCGLPVLNVRRARVAYNDYQSAAGNYVVMKNLGTNTSFAYMHLARPSKLKVGRVYDAGRRIGRVGQTGDAVGCHLHFEYWKGAWWGGGKPVDPLPYLKSLR